MSAICGVVGIDGRPWAVAELAGVARMQAVHGPDGQGRWAGSAGRCGVALAVALRHSTPEDAAEKQPVRNPDESTILVGDLRIDNRADLAGALGLRDERAPDGEIVLRSYDRWGESMFDRIVGDFALAIVDRRRGGVLLARDHMGTKPLAICERAGMVAFASMPLALTSLEEVGRDLDVRHAAEILALAYASERTFVKGVRWLPAGGAAWIDAGGVRFRKWWDPDPHETTDASGPEHARALGETFEVAVAARLRSAGRVGASVSGGLDSTSAAATAARLVAPERLPTFTAVPPPGWSGTERAGWDADESPLVRELASMHANMAPAFVNVPAGSNLFEVHEALWELGAGPLANPANALWMHALRRAASDAGVTTLMTGDFGNLFFSADGPEWLVALLRAGKLVPALREAARWRMSTGTGWYRTLRGDVAAHLAPRTVRRLRTRRIRGGDALEEWVSATALRPEIVATLDLPAVLPQVDEREARDRRGVALAVRAHYAGQADGAHAWWALTGVESRDPTADRRVIEVAMRQPEWIRRRAGTTRAVVREAMADRLPASILWRTGRGEQLPEWLDLMTAARREIAAELELLEGHRLSAELIDVPRLRTLVDEWPARERHTDPNIIRDYRLALLRALVVGRFLRWFERGARRT